MYFTTSFETIASARLMGSETIHRSAAPRSNGSHMSHPPAATLASTNMTAAQRYRRYCHGSAAIGRAGEKGRPTRHPISGRHNDR
jgi:hypothetical protein